MPVGWNSVEINANTGEVVLMFKIRCELALSACVLIHLQRLPRSVPAMSLQYFSESQVSQVSFYAVGNQTTRIT